MANGTDSIFTGANGAFIAELYERYLENPASVDASWKAVFSDLNDDAGAIQKDVSKASWARSTTKILGQVAGTELKSNGKPPATLSGGGLHRPPRGSERR